MAYVGLHPLQLLHGFRPRFLGVPRRLSQAPGFALGTCGQRCAKGDQLPAHRIRTSSAPQGAGRAPSVVEQKPEKSGSKTWARKDLWSLDMSLIDLSMTHDRP